MVQDKSQMDSNVDFSVVNDFGHEWEVMNQEGLPDDERKELFDEYFSLFPWDSLPEDSQGFDAGCGSGRWAALVSLRVGNLHCVDPSSAIYVARKNLAKSKNCNFHKTTVGDMPFKDGSMDFGYSLGVLHHIPDTQKAMQDCTKKLKQGAPFLVYLYYAFDNQPLWFKACWKVSDIGRNIISKLPNRPKFIVSQLIAAVVYYPLAKIALGLEKLGCKVHSIPLSAYRDKSFYTMRTDALDRFGTKLEQRFTREQIRKMMENSDLENIEFRPNTPFHCAIGYKK